MIDPRKSALKEAALKGVKKFLTSERSISLFGYATTRSGAYSFVVIGSNWEKYEITVEEVIK